MNETPAHHRSPLGEEVAADAVTPRAVLGRATGVVMALVPCTAETARRILLNAALTAGTTLPLMARAAAAAYNLAEESDPALERVLRTEIGHAQTPPAPLPSEAAALLPAPFVLRGHLDHLRAARRRTLSAPGDPAQRAELEDAAYTLCVLMGQRNAHGALRAAEQLAAAHRLPPSGPADSTE
ncbi:DUF5133 domain-containing protein [Streptomyces sp. NBC_01006]|uniref:DUF5133 domain-containing protein n=1 Tax=Streptomyces sp. NBC_01006 TaxID=2903716 RepID=UPI0038643021|nr:DUF5133 domain-containing protein [Streptomyces sp. NBC_01006]